MADCTRCGYCDKGLGCPYQEGKTCMQVVIIDGERYVPAKDVVSRDALLRALVEGFWGPERKWSSDEWVKKQASELTIYVSDTYAGDAVMVSDFVDRLGEPR